jgi:hypothetical protein
MRRPAVKHKSAAHPSICERPELSGPLGNLVRLLFAEAWRAKAQPETPPEAVDFCFTNLLRDSLRRNVATKSNIPHTQLTE